MVVVVAVPVVAVVDPAVVGWLAAVGVDGVAGVPVDGASVVTGWTDNRRWLSNPIGSRWRNSTWPS